MKRSSLFLGLLLGLFLIFSKLGYSQVETYSKDDRDKKYEYFGRDGHIHDNLIEYPIYTIPSIYGRLVSMHRSPFNPKERELWFEANDGTIRRIVLVPIKNRIPPYLIYQEVIRLDRD